MLSRTGYEIILVYQRAYKLLVAQGLRPFLQRLDNEASEALVAYLDAEQVYYQLTPAGIHRRNSAERAIRTFENQFIALLGGLDPNFPIKLWDKLIPQALITFNLLRASRLNPTLSVYSQMHGAFDFNRTPSLPLVQR